ncbi:PREDICTED: phosphatidylinositol 4-kinase gamma 7-like [Fragaria vesca subsp. vesca]|uniref:phosphatidylinositol 4-kinase gamma 7-like n=1 Tax=Fragaria vesca subsp. vesca TaxID=101020 RepID=UPI0002C34449|nr:PREDICTED: phosphatidylinositol 4-kinase gamma 7-like [Fragaria vesca subsp. vesca]
MPTKLESPVKTQMAVGLVSGLLNGECRKSTRGIFARRRRVFVQTEAGCVLGMELERGDNANTVKRKLQLALNVPTDHSSLTFGDRILNNDLSAIRSHSPLLLARNVMHRSSSTPCLSPTGINLQQWDRSGPLEILGCSKYFASIDELIKDIVVAIKKGIEPIPVHSGLGGAYYFRNIRGESVAIVKPTDEEPYAPNNPKGFVGTSLGQPGLKHSVRVGETGFREVAAYLLDLNHYANVPPTVLVKVTHSIFNVNYGVNGDKIQQKKKVSKIASLQQFIPHDFDAGDYGNSRFPVAGVHRIGILDIRIFNTDRHAGNILVKMPDGEFGQVELIPIDHGLCLPEHLEDPYFEWIHWPQASVPFSEDELEYIKNLDPIRDSEMLKMELPMIREACLRVLILSTIFLQEAAAFGLCLAEIGEMMSREFGSKEEKPSELEVVCLETRRIIEDLNMSNFVAEEDTDAFLSDIECDKAGLDHPPHIPSFLFKQFSYPFGTEGANSHYLLPKLDESLVEGNVDLGTRAVTAERIINQPDWYKPVSKLSVSLKKLNVDETGQLQRMGTLPEIRRSANDQLPTSTSFVKLADMCEEEWVLFLEKFRELLYPAFSKRRSTTIGQRRRLGTSCTF